MRTVQMLSLGLVILAGSPVTISQTLPAVDWQKIDPETLQHFQSLVRINSADPGGSEKPVAEYVLSVLQKEGIDAKLVASDPNRPNVVARLKGNGTKRPILIMGHSDTVNIDPKKWTHPPFGADRDGGWIYGRGTVDDKDNLVASLMTIIALEANECA